MHVYPDLFSFCSDLNAKMCIKFFPHTDGLLLYNMFLCKIIGGGRISLSLLLLTRGLKCYFYIVLHRNATTMLFSERPEEENIRSPGGFTNTYGMSYAY